MDISWTSQVTHTAAAVTASGEQRLATYTTGGDGTVMVAIGMEFASTHPQEPKSRSHLGTFSDVLEARRVCEAYCRNELPYEAPPKPAPEDPPAGEGATS